MAAEDGKIILNPYSLNTPEQQKLVARNEAARLHMRDTKYAPTFAVTPEQTASFAGTEYGKPGNEGFLRHTIVARILTGDPAAGKVTDEQKAAALEIQKALDKRR